MRNIAPLSPVSWRHGGPLGQAPSGQAFRWRDTGWLCRRVEVNAGWVSGLQRPLPGGGHGLWFGSPTAGWRRFSGDAEVDHVGAELGSLFLLVQPVVLEMVSVLAVSAFWFGGDVGLDRRRR